LLQPYSAELSPSFDPRLQQVLLYIEDHLADKLSLKRLARQVFLSESHLSLLNRQKLKMAPMEYVRQVRLHKARELLLTTNYRIKEIAEMVGFGEQSQLSSAFRHAVDRI
jgi:transcriptional regulator GlxA family with amidase domain